MKVFPKLLAWVSGGLLILVIFTVGGFWMILTYTADSMCDNQIISGTELRELNMNVVVFQRDCGATTGYSTQISLLGVGEELPNESGNIFTADTDHGKAPSAEGGGPEVRIEIISGDHVKILHHPNARVFNNQNQWKGVKISYGHL